MPLFPPIIDSSMPPFGITKEIIYKTDGNGNYILDNNNEQIIDSINYLGSTRIYFTNPQYNPTINLNAETQSEEDIQQVHLTLTYLLNNGNALNNSLNYVSKGIKINQGGADERGIHWDSTRQQYFVNIHNSHNYPQCSWQPDTLYKVQLRFSSKRCSKNTIWKEENQQYFSEWSTVCIIKPIYVPTFSISNIVNGELSSEYGDFIITYNQGTSKERLRKYWIKIQWNENNETRTYTSQQFVPGVVKYNKKTGIINLSCQIPFHFTPEVEYTITLYIQTENGYTANSQTVASYTQSSISFSENTKVTTSVNEQQGYIKTTLDFNEQSSFKYILRRASSKSNFLIWEDLFEDTVSSSKVYYYYDFTAQSGLAYRYMIQKIDPVTRGRGVPTYDQATKLGKATIGEWQHAFLWESAKVRIMQYPQNLNVKQLKLKFDLQLSSFNINIAESKTDTIGSKFPFIRRNGDMYYRSFPITGTIASQMDNAELFIKKDTLNDNQTNIYQGFKSTSKYYTTQYDYTYQRKFRQAVQEFLYNGKPKLYKSMQEGNILIRLMDISLTPKQQLGRLIYTFSATAYEIDQPTMENYQKYNMIKRK